MNDVGLRTVAISPQQSFLPLGEPVTYFYVQRGRAHPLCSSYLVPGFPSIYYHYGIAGLSIIIIAIILELWSWKGPSNLQHC